MKSAKNSERLNYLIDLASRATNLCMSGTVQVTSWKLVRAKALEDDNDAVFDESDKIVEMLEKAYHGSSR